MNDTKKFKKNLTLGIASHIFAIILGVVVPKLVLENYGSEINGLLSSVTNIYAYIAIVEAGVAAASCQALYKSIANQNQEQTNAILSATNKYYHRTGYIYLGLVVLFSVLYPILIKSNIPYHTIVLIILFNGFGNVVNYFFHGKYLILLKADGKNYIRTGLEMFTNVFKQVSKIVLIMFGFDVLFVQFIAMFASFIQMFYITYYMKKHYSWIDLSVKPDADSISSSKYVFAHEINYLITSNVDTVLLTIFSTLKKVSVYSIYNLLFGMINRVLRTLKDSIEFKIAYVFHKDKEHFLKIFKAFEVYYITLSFALFTVANYFILPFLSLYTKEVTDIGYTDKYLPFLFVMVNLLSAGRYSLDIAVYIAGHFKETRNSAITETVINILVSIVLLQFYDIYGVLVGTIISSLYRINYLILYVNKNIVKRSSFVTYKSWLINFVIYALLIWVNRFIIVVLDSYIKLFLFCIPYTIGVFILYFTVISISEPQSFRFVFSIVKKMIKKMYVKLKKSKEGEIKC